MAIADGLSDSMSLHIISEEIEIEEGKAKHTPQEIWLTMFFTFLSISGFTLSFLIPILIFPLKTAIIFAIFWGIFLLFILNFWIVKIKKEKPTKLIFEHILLALFVILISYWVGNKIPEIF